MADCYLYGVIYERSPMENGREKFAILQISLLGESSQSS